MIVRVGANYFPVDAIDRIHDRGDRLTVWSSGMTYEVAGAERDAVLDQLKLLMPREHAEESREFAPVKGRRKS